MTGTADWLVLGMVGWLAGNAVSLAITVGVLVGLLLLKQGTARWRRERDLDPWAALSLSAVLALITASGLFGIVVLWGLDSALESAYMGIELRTQVTNIVLSFVILGGAYALSDFVGHLIKDLASDHETLSVHEREILHRLSQVTIYTFGLLIVIGLFTDNIGGLLVGAGFLGIVVGMAARQTLGSVLAGFVIMFSKPFEVGDWIAVSDNEGIVTDITIVNTRIRSFDGEYVILPNDEVNARAITNRTRRGRLRIEVVVGVDYETDPAYAREIARAAVAELDSLLAGPAPQVVTANFGDSAIELAVRGWIDNPSARKRAETRSDMIGAIHTAFAENNIKIPYPQRELTGRAETGGFRVANGEQPATADGSRDTREDTSGGFDR